MSCEFKIDYSEMGIILNSDENRNVIHKEIYDVVSLKKNMASGRDVIFSVIEHPQIRGKAFCIVRGEKLNAALSSKHISKIFRKDESCEYQVDFVITNAKGTRKMSAPEIHEKIHRAFMNIGISVAEYSYPDGVKTIRMHKSSRDSLNTIDFHIPFIQLFIKGTIVDPELVAKGWLLGIGRNKGYGFGMLRESY